MSAAARFAARAAGLLWPTLMAALALLVLIGLGTWQVQRMYWKQDLIARIETRAHAEPMSLEEAVRLWRQTGDVEYTRVRLAGEFDHGRELHLFTVVGGRMGWQVIAPLLTPEGPVVLVDRGFVPDALKAPRTRPAGQVAGRVELVGLARAPETPGLFTPDNEPAGNVWHWRDLDAMTRAALPPDRYGRAVPFFVEAEAGPVPGGYPRGGVTRLDLPDNHLQYALTWYGLAAALVAVYGFFVAGRLRAERFTD